MKKLLFLILISTVCNLYGQDDPLYSQYHYNQLMINPAYAGLFDRLSASVISRKQWAGIDGAPTTNTVSVQSSAFNGNIGLGGYLIHDQFGVNKNTDVQFTYSYNVKFDRSKLSLGMQGGMINYQYDYAALDLDYLDDTEITEGLYNFSKSNFGVGLMYMSEKLLIGCSVPHILNASVKESGAATTVYNKNYYATAAYIFDYATGIKVKLGTMIKYSEQIGLTHDITLSVLTDDFIWVGFTARNFKHYGLNAMLLVSKSLRFGYSFELPANSLIRTTYGTHEISLSFDVAVLGSHSLRNNRYF